MNIVHLQRMRLREEEKNDDDDYDCFRLARSGGIPRTSSKSPHDSYPTPPSPLPACTQDSTNALVTVQELERELHHLRLYSTWTAPTHLSNEKFHVILDPASPDQTTPLGSRLSIAPESRDSSSLDKFKELALAFTPEDSSLSSSSPPQESQQQHATLGHPATTAHLLPQTPISCDDADVDCSTRVDVPFLMQQEASKIAGHQSKHRFPRLARMRRRLRRRGGDEDDEEEEKRRRIRREMKTLQRRYFWYPSTYVLRIENEHPSLSAVVLIRDLHNHRQTEEDRFKFGGKGGPTGGELDVEAAHKYIFETPKTQRFVVRPESHQNVNVNEGDVVLVTVCFKTSPDDPFYYASDMNIQVNCDTQYYIIEEADLQEGVGSLKVDISIVGGRVVVSNFQEAAPETCACPPSGSMMDSSTGNTVTGPHNAPDGNGNCDVL